MFPHTKPPAGTQINPLHPLSNGLVGCWLFNEGAGSLSNDLSGYKNHGRLTNMAPNVQGSGWGGSKFGGGLDFDGVDDYVDTNYNIDFGTTKSATISACVLSNENSVINSVIAGSLAEKGSDDPMVVLSATTSSFAKPRFAVRESTTLHYEVYAISNINDGYYHYLSGVIDRTNNQIRFYIDGGLQGTAAVPVEANLDLSGNNMFIGALNLRNISSQFCNCSIRSTSIYNRALSAGEITWLHREPYAMFEPAFNPAFLYSAAPPVGAIMNQFQKANIGADLYNGVFA